MKLLKFIKRLLRKFKRRPDPIAEAFAEGIREAFKEMGYKAVPKNKNIEFNRN